MLEAPPGAGKTTRAPLALLSAPWRGDGAIILLEPRRAAARAAAARLAAQLGGSVGGVVGYRIRDEARTSDDTRILVATEGVLTRRLQSDPALEGVAAVVFDEFHERSIHADLGLALCLEAQAHLREDLRLLAMSATLDGAAVAALMGGAGPPAPILRSDGRQHPVETRWRASPLGPDARTRHLDAVAADAVLDALADADGDVLVFLPGAAEIGRTARRLAGRVGAAAVTPLYGDLPEAAQRRALDPDPDGRRKIILSTNLAETSLTIDGVRIVVDAGFARRARFDRGAGLTRLVTTRVSKAAATQRRGRAGRQAPGVCIRLWTKAEEGGFPESDPPEILETDLAPLALDLACWGADAADLAFLDPPPETALADARNLLRRLGALDADGKATPHGRRLAATPLHPRLAHLLASAADPARARLLVALLDAKDPWRGDDADLSWRVRALEARRGGEGEASPRDAAAARIVAAAKRLKKRGAAQAGDCADRAADSVGALVALAFPDRLAARRSDRPSYVLSNGAGAALRESDPLAAEPYLAIAELGPANASQSADAAIRLAAPITLDEINVLYRSQIRCERICQWSRRDRRVAARERRVLFEMPLSDRPWPDPPPDQTAAAMAEGVRHLGLQALPWSDGARRLRGRVGRARADGADLPDFSDAGLLASLDLWLTPHLGHMRRAADLEKLVLEPLLRAQLDWNARATLEAAAPAAFAAPTGEQVPIDYGDGNADTAAPPRIRIKLQELFGIAEHPIVAGAPLLIELLSPAGRPLQTTADLPGFWRGSYVDVAKEMRSRYPKHPWPDDPLTAAPTRRAKPRRR